VASLKVAVDADGVVLQTADDLPLARLTTARNLKWATLIKEGAALVLFQGDGTVAEEFKIAHPENLMSFDAGEVELRPPGYKPKAPVVVPKRKKALRPGDDL
jgi:transcriptional regulator of nitric oxide reductase